MSMGGYFQSNFPGMKPISGAPNLVTIWGTGLMMYGSRDRDVSSGTYVATRFFTILFVPILAIDAYRVADAAPHGWYFLGKVPLSKTTTYWNIAFALIAVTAGLGFGWTYYTNRPDTIAARLVADGDRLAAEGKVGAAARKYHDAAAVRGASSDALEKMSQLFQGSLDQADGAELAEAFTVGVESFRIHKAPDKLVEVALKQAKQRAASDEATALKILNAVEPIAPFGDLQIVQAKKPILEKMHTARPDDLDVISDLAAVYEAEKALDKCEKLLLPKLAKLGDREGARILGQILLNKGDYDKAETLLLVYTQDRLKKIQEQDREIQDVIKRCDERALAELNSRKAKGFDYDRHKSLQNNRAAQVAMEQAFLDVRLRADPDFQRVSGSRYGNRRVVEAALDLGVAQLRLAQGIGGEGRRTGLEKAEQTFLSLAGIAGQHAEYRLRLGQVYYWLGKQAEGRKLFDDVLAAEKHSAASVMAVANTLREVGASSEAKKLTEEAWQKEPAGKTRDAIARIRTACVTDIDDRLLWLSRIQTPERADQASLAWTRGNKALVENRDVDAAKYFREALEHFAAIPESSAQLNNSALVYVSLYRVTGDPKDNNDAIANFEKAIGLQPRDSILISNTAHTLLGNSLRAIAGDTANWKVLKSEGSMDLLGYFYNDKAKKNHYRAQLRQHEGIKKARTYYERVIVLAPRNSSHYAVLAAHYAFLQDRDELFQMLERVGKTALDHGDAERTFKEAQDGTKKDQYVKDLENSAASDVKRVQEARRVGGITLAIALGRQVHTKVSLQVQGRPVDNDEMVAWAEEAFKAAPSHGSQGTWIDALLARAHRDLMKKDAQFAASAKKHQHWLGNRYLLAIALGNDTTQKACLANADVQRACALLKSQCDTYEEDFNEWTWAMLRKIDPEWAAAQVKRWEKNDLIQASRAINKQLAPPTALTTYQQYWGYLMQGRQAEADDNMRKISAQGLPTTK